MCGIVGYVGPKEAVDFLIEGLRRLEYRGYDSSGIVTIDDDTGDDFNVTKTAGRIDELAAKLKKSPTPGRIGLGHTRWATYGPATDQNAHPHLGGDAVVAVVHNGVIENFRALKQRLLEEGYEFKTATDTEVIAHLIADELEKRSGHTEDAVDPYAPLFEAVQAALAQLRGTYGLGIMFRDWPDVIVAARLQSPLVIGIGKGEHYIASDASPLVGHTDKIVYLADNEIAVITDRAIRVVHRDDGHVDHDVKLLETESNQVELAN